MKMTSSQMSSEQRELFGAIADNLIPAYREFPSATEIGVHQELCDVVLAVRPDLLGPMMRALEKVDRRNIKESIELLYQTDPGGFDAISTVASGAYYMNATVRSILGYPGQESIPVDVLAASEYLEEDRLDRVIKRGSIYRVTPRE